MKLFIYFSRSH